MANTLDLFIRNYGFQHIAFKILMYLDTEDFLKIQCLSKQWYEFDKYSKILWKSRIRQLVYKTDRLED